MNQASLLSLHLQNIKEKKDIDYTHIPSLIELFGGIDTVLTTLLTSTQIRLSEHQINRIHKILSTKDTTFINTKETAVIMEIMDSLEETERKKNNILKLPHKLQILKPKTQKEQITPIAKVRRARKKGRRTRSGTIHDKEENAPIEWRYCFSRNNTFIHSIFGEITGQKIFDFLYEKWVILIVFILSCLLLLLWFIANDIIRIIYLYIVAPLMLLYLSFHLLSVNKRCFYLMVCNFEFIVKLIYGTQFVIATFIYWDVSLGLGILIGITTFLAISLLSLTDGLQFSVPMKILFGVTISLYYTTVALYCFFILSVSYENDVILHITDSTSISVIQILTQSSQLLALFFWRTTILSVIKKKRCILITYSPFLRWERDVINCRPSLVSTANRIIMDEMPIN